MKEKYIVEVVLIVYLILEIKVHVGKIVKLMKKEKKAEHIRNMVNLFKGYLQETIILVLSLKKVEMKQS